MEEHHISREVRVEIIIRSDLPCGWQVEASKEGSPAEAEAGAATGALAGGAVARKEGEVVALALEVGVEMMVR